MGPIASVLLPRILSEGDAAALDEFVKAVSCRDLGQHPSLDAFWVCDARPIGGRYMGQGRPFAIERDSETVGKTDATPQIISMFGFRPAEKLAVIAYCNGDEDHEILGQLVLNLAERFGGVIDFGGALWELLPPEVEIMSHPEWRSVEPYFREMVSHMPGRVVSVLYEPQPGREWAWHVGDVSFMRAWLAHPNFRMVK